VVARTRDVRNEPLDRGGVILEQLHAVAAPGLEVAEPRREVRGAGGQRIEGDGFDRALGAHLGLRLPDVARSARLLLDPAARDFKLLRIAFEAGFNSKSVFNIAFKKIAGISPSEFRRLLGDGAAGGDS